MLFTELIFLIMNQSTLKKKKKSIINIIIPPQTLIICLSLKPFKSQVITKQNRTVVHTIYNCLFIHAHTFVIHTHMLYTYTVHYYSCFKEIELKMSLTSMKQMEVYFCKCKSHAPNFINQLLKPIIPSEQTQVKVVWSTSLSHCLSHRHL